jgi:hypothetical protein
MGVRLVLNREPRVLVIGSLFVILGLSLLLDRLDLVYFRWDKLFWLVGCITGGFLVTDGYVRKKRGRVFWGGLLFFFAAYQSAAHIGLIERFGFYTLPALFISFGLAFMCLYLLDPSEFSLLIPAFLLCGAGVTSVLWWWEVVDLYEVRYFVRTYWPLVLVALGLSIMARPRRSSRPTGSEMEQTR